MKLYVINNETIWISNVNVEKKGLCFGNWFSGWRIPFVTVLSFMYCWAEKLTSIKWCKKQLFNEEI